jgi:hypothetical protein
VCFCIACRGKSVTLYPEHIGTSQPRQGNLKLAEMRKKKNLKGEEVEKSLGTAVIAVIVLVFWGMIGVIF